MLRVHAIPAFTDNYIWLLQSQNSQKVIIVDPCDSERVEQFVQAHHLVPAAIFLTHHHYDHVHGVKPLRDRFAIPVYGPRKENTFWVTQSIDPGTTLELGEGFPTFQVLDTSGHTAGHISYYTDGLIFCGDTLFAGGCGRLLGGTMQQLYHSLQRLKQLPDDTLIYCTHEYTQSNMRFALAVEPNNQALIQRSQQVNQARLNQQATVPSTLVTELATNPFLRTQSAEIKKAAEAKAGRLLESDFAVFSAIRQWKDRF